MWQALADGIGVLMASHVFFGECGVQGGFFVLLFFFFGKRHKRKWCDISQKGPRTDRRSIPV